MVFKKQSRAWLVKLSYVYVGILVFFSIVGDRGLWQSYKLWRENAALSNEIVLLQKTVLELESQVANFQKDDKTIERYAREKMNLAGDDEIQYIFK